MSGDAEITPPAPPAPVSPRAPRPGAVTERTALRDLQRDQLSQLEREITRSEPR